MLRKSSLALAAVTLGSFGTFAAAEEPKAASPDPSAIVAVASTAEPALPGVGKPVASPYQPVRVEQIGPPKTAAAYSGIAPTIMHDNGSWSYDGDDHSSEQHGGIAAGAGFYYLRPYISNNPAFVTNTGIGTPRPTSSTTDFDWSYKPAAAFWLGYALESGLGLRARFFYFDQASSTSSTSLTAFGAATTTITAAPGLQPVGGFAFASPGILLTGGVGQDQLAFSSNLKIQNYDFEVTFAWNFDCFALVFSGGGRYTQIAQNYNAALTNVPGGGASEFDTLNVNHTFVGGGPTVAIQGTWQIGHTGLAVFGTARGSITVGSGLQDTVFTQIVTDPVNGNQNNVATNHVAPQQVLPIMELEVGLEYGVTLGQTRWFVRGAGVSQTYFGAGSSTSRDNNLSLFGGQVSFGIDY
jgi:hypothetical protein